MSSSTECYCGDSYGSYGLAKDNGVSCDISCPNEKNEVCGGDNANWIYVTGFNSKLKKKKQF